MADDISDTDDLGDTVRPLDDVVVLDLTRALAGPIASRLLADLGADVVKIEPQAGDLTRFMVPQVDGMSAYYAQYNAGKRCVSLDLTSDMGRDVFLRMVPRADVVLENYRPGVMERMGLGFDVLSEVNPRIILASVSGWGSGNSRSGQGAFASAIHAEAGVTERVARQRDEAPRNDPMSHSDTYTGLHAFGSVLAALHLRHRTGRGTTVEVDMASSTLTVNDLAAVELTGAEPQSGFRAGQHWSPILPLRTGRYVNITVDVTAKGGFTIIAGAMGRTDLADDPRFADEPARMAHRQELIDEVFAPWVAGFDTAAELEAAIGESTILCAEVRSVTELAATDWAAERGAFTEVDTGRGEMLSVPQTPFRFGAAASGVGARAGYRGEDNAAVLKDLAGVSDAELAVLEEEGVISARPPRWARDT